MEKWIIGANEQSQRLDKYLKRRMPAAASSFLYRMLRKKNITLNGARAEGKEILHAGDEVSVFFSRETLDKFMDRGNSDEGKETSVYIQAYAKITETVMHGKSPILYEDEHILLAVKPAGVLSQKAKPEDVSMNEWFLGYLLQKKELSPEDLSLFKPSVCNRLDYHTGGILLCAKTLPASQMFAALLKDRSLHKYYHMVVRGQICQPGVIRGYLEKDTTANKVSFKALDACDKKQKETGSPEMHGKKANAKAMACKGADAKARVCKGLDAKEMPGKGAGSGNSKQKGKAVYSETRYTPLRTGEKFTLLEALLITGKTHQLRAHLASEGHPIAGDPKYGDVSVNTFCRKKYGLQGQLLFACRIRFPEKMPAPFGYLQGREFTAPDPALFEKFLKE